MDIMNGLNAIHQIKYTSLKYNKVKTFELIIRKQVIDLSINPTGNRKRESKLNITEIKELNVF